MHRASDTIGTIAAALAKAQAQLVNPEKSLVATIRSDEASGSERSFRYAPLSSGLDIVRKTLSQYEIATVQTTSIDETAGIVQLSTVAAAEMAEGKAAGRREGKQQHMLRTGDQATEALFWDEFVRQFQGMARQVKRKLEAINAAVSLEDLKVPPANRLEKLKGNLKDFYSIRINDQWRVIFRWVNREAHDVRIVDYH